MPIARVDINAVIEVRNLEDGREHEQGGPGGAAT